MVRAHGRGVLGMKRNECGGLRLGQPVEEEGEGEFADWFVDNASSLQIAAAKNR